MQKFFSIILVSLLGLQLYANTGVVQGTVKTKDGNAAEFVNMLLIGTQKGATVSKEGNFRIENVKPGTYTLRASFVGLETVTREVTVSDGQTTKVDLTIHENSKELTEVVVTANPARYVADYPSVSLRLQTPLLEVPQNIQVVTKQVIQEQQSFDMLEAVTRNVSGARRMEHWDNYAVVYMRGAQIAAYRNGMNVTMFWSPQTEDMSTTERIEFVKGPAGFMLANAEPSGFYNVVTKKPTGIQKGEVAMTIGSYNTYRTTLDLDGKLDKTGKLLYRFNAMAQSKGSHRPFEYNNRILLAPVLKYIFNDQTSLTAEYTYSATKSSPIGTNYAFSPKGYADMPVDFSTAEANMAPTKLNEQTAFLTMLHKFDDNWRFTGQVAYIRSEQIGQSLWPNGFNTAGDSIQRGASIWDYLGESKVGQFFVNGDINTGPLRHRILAGIDMSDKTFFHDWSQSGSFGALNIYNPEYGHVAASAYPVYDRSLDIRQRGVKYREAYTGYYVQDEIGLFDNKLRLTLAGRYTTSTSENPYNGNVDASKFTPRVGLSYSINKSTSAYAVLDQSFMPQAGADFYGNAFKPSTGTNKEIGLKREWFNGDWQTTLSAYHITKNNVLVADPDDKHPNKSVQLGQTKTKGIEFDLRGQITEQLSITANYALTDAVISDDATVANIGKDLPGVTTNLANAWLTYRFTNKTLKGLGLSLGEQFQGGRKSWDTDGSGLPDYFRLDGAISYQSKKFSIALNVNNLTNSYLYSGGFYYGFYYWQTEPRTNYRVNVSYRF